MAGLCNLAAFKALQSVSESFGGSSETHIAD